MKSLELSLNKRLLIMEFDDMHHLEIVLSCDKQGIRFCNDNDESTKLICKGSDLTEDIAKGFFTYEQKFNNFNRFIEGYRLGCALHHTSLSAFISAIQSKNYHWGENPYEKELDSCNAYTDMFTIAKRARKYEEAESRTFYPDKCIIFQIL